MLPSSGHCWQKEIQSCVKSKSKKNPALVALIKHIRKYILKCLLLVDIYTNNYCVVFVNRSHLESVFLSCDRKIIYAAS